VVETRTQKGRRGAGKTRTRGEEFMNISKLALIALLGSALTAFGCSSDSDGPGGTGGGGGAIDPLCQPVAGECMGGAVDAITECPDPGPPTCDVWEPPADDDVEDACTGSESTDNPASCATGGSTITYRLTQMLVAEDCSLGFDLDGCDGETCKASEATLTSPDGANGVDNSLSSLTPVLPTFETSLTGVEQAFYDSLCGLTNDVTQGVCVGGTAAPDTACVLDKKCDGGTNDGMACATGTDCPGDKMVPAVCNATTSLCDGGANDGTACTTDTDCPGERAVPAKCDNLSDDACPNGDGNVCANDGEVCTTDADCTPPDADTCVPDEGTCNLDNDDCQQEIAAAVITFEVNENPAAGCATVVVRTEGVEGMTTSFVNLSAANGDGNFCMSGKLKAISMPLLDFDGDLGNPSIRATLSPDGLSHGVLGATVDSETAVAIAKAISPIAASIVEATFDISSTLTQDTSATCDALSMTLEIGGVTVTP
jgi:hypothetical protein